MNRRDLIRSIAIGGATIILPPMVFTTCEKGSDPGGNNNGTGNDLKIDLTLPANADLLSPGGFVVVSDVIVINSAGTYIALSVICTHAGCRVSYNASAGNLPCPCHGSVFSTAGAVVNGPADSPLPVYSVTKSGNILTIKK